MHRFINAAARRFQASSTKNTNMEWSGNFIVIPKVMMVTQLPWAPEQTNCTKKVHIEIKINVKLSYIIICVLISSASIQNLSLGRDIFHNIYTKFDSSSCNTEGKGDDYQRGRKLPRFRNALCVLATLTYMQASVRRILKIIIPLHPPHTPKSSSD